MRSLLFWELEAGHHVFRVVSSASLIGRSTAGFVPGASVFLLVTA